MKDITNKQLAKKIDHLENLIEKLAISTKIGFDETRKENKKEFGKIKKELAILKYDLEEIKTKSANTPYRFELIELQKRVDVLEKKVGIAR